MTIRSHPYRSRRPSAMTLVEVLAALMILGTVLASILIGRARYSHQLSVAERRLAAARHVDALIGAWMNAKAGIPVPASAGLDDGLAWRTRLVTNAEAARLLSRVVRLEIFDPMTPVARAAPTDREAAAGTVLVTIDLLAPLPEPEKAPDPEPANDAPTSTAGQATPEDHQAHPGRAEMIRRAAGTRPTPSASSPATVTEDVRLEAPF